MSETSMLVLVCIAGVWLGAVFFGGLWWTLGKALASQRPALWVVSSALVRMGLTLGGFYVVSAGHWQRMLLCLLGFLASRFAVTRLTRPRTSSAKEVGHSAQS